MPTYEPSTIGTWFLNLGGGVNSSALAVELMARGYPAPAAAFFADTGGERPETYAHVDDLSAMFVANGWPPVEVVRWIRKVGPNAGRFISIEEQCLTRKELPSLAYGRKGCSVKWKGQPIDAAVKAHPATIKAQSEGRRVIRVLGYDADEPHRWNRFNDNDLWSWWAPLVEWNMGRFECLSILRHAGFGGVPKSACFFCPATKEREILSLPPNLQRRALAIEDNAEHHSPTHGLGGAGRRWSSVVEFHDRQARLWPEVNEVPCGCFDGGGS